ncbi:thioredoxin-like protein [Limtongia smithiae]|uniref:thioredoxin-like protein n=1 Tax=Limtongia smithiae TaxID=1125753 RepID=UPI0034CD3B87
MARTTTMAMRWRAVVLLVVVFLASVVQAGFYGKNTEVLNLTPANFDDEILNTNHTSIVEFYAEWCGHCKNLRPHFIKAAQSLSGVAKVAAVHCEDAANKPLCSRYGVRGYPTLKIFRPSTKRGATVPPGGSWKPQPIVEDYTGGRHAKAISDTVVEKIANRVKRLKAAEIEGWIAEQNNERIKVILFTDKANTPPMFKALAVDFANSADFGVVRSADSTTMKKYGASSYPSVVVAARNNETGESITVLYSGANKKLQLYYFISQYATPSEGPKAQVDEGPKSKKARKNRKYNQKPPIGGDHEEL